MYNWSQKGIIKTLPLLMVVAGAGIISFLLLSSTAPFKGSFDNLFPKKSSHAASATFETLTVKDTNYPLPTSNVLYVAPTTSGGSDSNPGTLTQPLATIGAAVTKAQSGFTIVIRAGTYHESVSTQKQLTFQPYPHETVWFKGSTALVTPNSSNSFVSDTNGSGGAVWRMNSYPYIFKDASGQPWGANIDQNLISGGGDNGKPSAAYPDMVFYDSQPEQQVLSLAQVVPGTFFIDYPNAQLYLGDNPSGHTVEAADLHQALSLADGAQPGSIIRGLGFMEYSDYYNMNFSGMVRVNTTNLTIENNTFAYAAQSGLDVYNNNNEVDGNTFLYNGLDGMSSSNNNNLTLTSNRFAYNNLEHFSINWSAAGAKMEGITNSTWSDNILENNYALGLWCDIDCDHVNIVRNVAGGNAMGIMYEISANGILASNVIYNNTGFGLYIHESQNTKIYNNSLSNNGTDLAIYDNNRNATSDPGDCTINPDVTCNVSNMDVKDNLFSTSDSTNLPIAIVDDWTRQRLASQMISAWDNNGYYRASSTSPTNTIQWGQGTSPSLFYATDSLFKQATKFDTNGFFTDNQSTDPYFTNFSAGNFNLTSNSPAIGTGVILPQDVAAAINSGLITPVATTTAAANMGALSYPTQLTPTPTPALIPGDIDGNNKVDIFDYNILIGNFGKTGVGIQGDLDGNNKVDIFDYNILIGNFGKSS